MRTITLNIDEEVYQGLLSELSLRDFSKGCVSEPFLLESMMIGIVRKMKEGKREIYIEKKRATGDQISKE